MAAKDMELKTGVSISYLAKLLQGRTMGGTQLLLIHSRKQILDYLYFRTFPEVVAPIDRGRM